MNGGAYGIESPEKAILGRYRTFAEAEDALAVRVARDVIVPVRDMEDGYYYPCLTRKDGRRISDEPWHGIAAIGKAFADPRTCKELLMRALELSDEAFMDAEARSSSKVPNFPEGWSAEEREGGWILLRHGKPCRQELFASRRQALDRAQRAFVREHLRIDTLDGGQSVAILWKTADPLGAKVVWEGFADGLAAEACLHRRVKGFLWLIAHGFWPDRDVERIALQDARRSGPPRREGSAEPEAFLKTFGFHGVEFGLWNNQAERQRLLDMAWDGLMDLADVLGVPPCALSLGGQLSLAFGTRGNGGPWAGHYEYERAVINLTKTKGAGCLAHEWFHAFDHYLARVSGLAGSVRRPLGDGGTGYAVPSAGGKFYSAAMRHSATGRVSAVFVASWERLETSVYQSGMTTSPFTSAAWRLDGMRVVNEAYYWSDPAELMARAFEAFVEDEIAGRGQVSEFLVNGTRQTVCGVSPYPQGAQRSDIGKAMRSLMPCAAEMLRQDAPRQTARQG